MTADAYTLVRDRLHGYCSNPGPPTGCTDGCAEATTELLDDLERARPPAPPSTPSVAAALALLDVALNLIAPEVHTQNLTVVWDQRCVLALAVCREAATALRAAVG